jgi:hypothetical protein
MIRATSFVVALALASFAPSARGADWILAPSTFTHDPQTGQRVTQFAPIEPVFVETAPDYRKSGYRHNRSSIYSGDGADHHHIVEEWGRPVRPYGEWLFPYRPYSVPYHLWGAPYAGLGFPAPWGGGWGQGGWNQGGWGRPGGLPPGGDEGVDPRRNNRRDDADWWIRDPRNFENYHPDLLPRRPEHENRPWPIPRSSDRPERFRDGGDASGPTGYSDSGRT